MTLIERLTFRMWLDELDNPDATKRLIAGHAVCELAGVDAITRAMSPNGSLRPPPAWPLVDIVPARAERLGAERWLVAEVRTQVGGGVLTEEQRVSVPLADGALMEAVERGRSALSRRIEGMVIG